jgi:DNA-binding transcriptional ArsR family regulator
VRELDHPSAGAGETPGDALEALANPRRRAILELLTASPLSLGAIANEMPVTRQAVSGHLRFLSSAGLVIEEVAGARRRYRLNKRGVAAVRAYLDLIFGSDRG